MEKYNIPSLKRALDILHLVASKGSCSANEIINELNIPKSSVYLLLEDMKNHNLLNQDTKGDYQLWFKLVELGNQVLSGVDIKEITRPFLIKLSKETNLLCHLGVLHNKDAYSILKIESESNISVRSFEGKKLSLFNSGIGKCLLAWQKKDKQSELINNITFEPTTHTTITDIECFKKEIAQIKQNGWSFDNGENDINIRCVAAPIFDARNELIAAIAAVGTSLQIKNHEKELLAEKVISYAQNISREFGWNG